MPPLIFPRVGGCWDQTLQPRTVATMALAVRRSNHHSVRSHPLGSDQRSNRNSPSCLYWMPRARMRKQKMSVYSSMLLEVGFPAPCPAFVSSRIISGFFCTKNMEINSVADPVYPGSRIQKQQQKRGVKKIILSYLFCSNEFHKMG